MARPTLFSNRKLLKLAQRLQSRALAVGTLELLWHVANETGNPVLGDPDDVETIADWRGPRGELVAALTEAGSNGGPGFIVRRSDGRLEIHDYWHHAPDYVRKRAKREEARREKGDDFERDWSLTGQNGHHEAENDQSMTGQNATFPDCLPGVPPPPHSLLPLPTPAPSPSPKDKKERDGAAHARPAPVAIEKHWLPDEANMQWLAGSGLTIEERSEVIREFVLWGTHSDLRKTPANWQMTFARNPKVKSSVGMAKARREKNGHADPARIERTVAAIARDLKLTRRPDETPEEFAARAFKGNDRRLDQLALRRRTS